MDQSTQQYVLIDLFVKGKFDQFTGDAEKDEEDGVTLTIKWGPN